MHEKLSEIVEKARAQMDSISSLPVLGEIKARFIGKKSELTQAMVVLKDMKPEEKASFGKAINDIKDKLTTLFEDKEKELKEKELNKKLSSEKVDISLPGQNYLRGSKHPFQIIVDDLTDYFMGLGYRVAEGPEVELDRYNFELLNIPQDHPSRDMQDSFFIDNRTLMRSHTSPVQAHVLEEAKGQGPIKIICPGKVFRRDDDATHSHQFGQIEALVIDKDVNLASLMETLTMMLRHLFGEKREVRFRPSYFPFTEPSVEVDVSCFNCGGKGCKLCKNSGWIEILGAGMVHPNVLRMTGFDDKVYQGFAFGVGIERLAMLKYGIDDIRRFYTDDVNFLKQFIKE